MPAALGARMFAEGEGITAAADNTHAHDGSLVAKLTGGLHRALLDELASLPGGATTLELRARVGRRHSTVLAALAMLEQEGAVVRQSVGKGRGWRERRWKLATSGRVRAGTTSEALVGRV